MGFPSAFREKNVTVKVEVKQVEKKVSRVFILNTFNNTFGKTRNSCGFFFNAQGLEKRFQSDYQALVDPLHKKNFRMAFISGLANGFTNSIFFFIYAAGFRMSTWLIIKGKMKQEDSFKVLFSLMFASMGVGSSSAYLADFAKAQIAADRVFKQLETQPVINNDEQSTRSAKGAKGHVEFEFIK